MDRFLKQYFHAGCCEKFKTLCLYFHEACKNQIGRVVTKGGWLSLTISHVSLIIWLPDVTWLNENVISLLP